MTSKGKKRKREEDCLTIDTLNNDTWSIIMNMLDLHDLINLCNSHPQLHSTLTKIDKPWYLREKEYKIFIDIQYKNISKRLQFDHLILSCWGEIRIMQKSKVNLVKVFEIRGYKKMKQLYETTLSTMKNIMINEYNRYVDITEYEEGDA